MAVFYGQVQGSADTSASRRGSNASGISASVQSWHGSVITSLHYDDDKLMVDVYTDDGSSFLGRLLFSGTFDEFKEKLGK